MATPLLQEYFQSQNQSPQAPRVLYPNDQGSNSQEPPQQHLHHFTNSTPDIQELHQIMKDMRNTASPGPDGLNAAFYKASWNWLSKDVHKLVSDFYRTASFSQEINRTYITLIPKRMQPILPQDFRPISLCNVIYRLIAKSLADRLKPHLPNYIDQAQSAFVKNRHISSNIFVTQEIIHSFSLKHWKCKAFILKIDLAKAFDRLSWDFLTQALQRLRLHQHFINHIRACFTTASMAILVNGQPTSYFTPKQGIRQGCPLSPFLFAVAINELSIALNNAMQAANLTGITLGPNCPPIHSLLFADDLILCGAATTLEANSIDQILNDFCHHFGQIPNLSKSYIHFSHC